MKQLRIWKISCLGLMGVMSATPVLAGKILDEILAKKTIVVGYRENALPYSFLDNEGTGIGYSLDICRKIIEKISKEKKIELKVQYQPVGPQNWIPMIQNGALHMACASTTITPGRSEKASFVTINTDVISPAVLSTNISITKKEDLKGKKVIVTSGSTGEKTLIKLNEEDHYNISIVPVQDIPEAFQLLDQGGGDAVVSDKVVLTGKVALNADSKKYKVLDIPLTPVSPIGVMFIKGDADLEKLIQAKVAAMKQDESLFKLHDQWFNQPMGPKNINLNLALTPEQKKIIMDAK
jgi:glutamate/aspartate transport system substrate-binding protein